jgi:tRNA threonylcarbamoyladenosine biosynthesis protein TsaB
MALILSIETALDICSAAIHENGILKAYSQIAEPRQHALRLAVLIRDIFHQAGCSPAQLSAVAVSAGPGSYTGLRIGASTAKGLCFGLSIPLIGVNTLDIIAHQARQVVSNATLYCPVIDARRMDVFFKITTPEGEEIVPVTATTLTGETFAGYLQEGQVLCFAGNGAAKCRQFVTTPQAVFLPDVHPRADALGELAFARWRINKTDNPATFEPAYAKEFFSSADIKIHDQTTSE